jgi:hypothetical protein
MLLKKQLLSQQNLNNAFLSLITGGAQTIQSTLNISGGAITLKNTILTDNANTSYFRIDPQGNQVIIYDGVSNQQLSIYSSSGSESTYITTINQASNQSYGLIDVAGASVDHLEINTNSWKPTYFGGTISTKLSTFTYPTGSTIPPVFRAIGPSGDFRITVQDGNGRANLTWNSYYDGVSGTSRYSTTGDAALRLFFDPGTGFTFYTAPSGTSGNAITWTTGIVNSINGNVGIGTTSPENAEGWSRVFDLLGATNAKLSVRSNLIDSRILAHESGWFGAPAGMIIGTKTNHPISIATNGSSRLTVDSNGNVSIGHNSPASKLHIKTNTAQSTDGINVTSTNKNILIMPEAGNGSYSPINNGGGMTSIVYSRSGADDSANRLTIAPWSAYNGGISLNYQGFFDAGTWRQTVIPLSGSDGACNFGTLDNHYCWQVFGAFAYFKLNNINRLTNGTTGRPTTWVVGIVCANGAPYDGATIQLHYNSGAGGAYKAVNMTGTIPAGSLGTVKVLSASVNDFNPMASQNLGADWRIASPANPSNGNFGILFMIFYDQWSDCFHTFEAYPGAAGPYWSRIAGVCNARGARMVIPVGTNMYAT